MKGDFKRVVDVVEKMDDYDMMISGVHTRLSTQETSSETPKDTTSLGSTMTWFGNVSEEKLGNASGWRVINKSMQLITLSLSLQGSQNFETSSVKAENDLTDPPERQQHFWNDRPMRPVESGDGDLCWSM